jgi:uncharacterized repeat protein (TIGR01451 family)
LAGPPPLPEQVVGPWAPPGIARPWPPDEYLHDGGDRGLPAHVDPDWFVHGLEPEDAVAHYDLLDGRTVVEPSNRVHIYSPRFAAVRSVTGLTEGRNIEVTHGVDLPTGLARHDLLQIPAHSKQHEQPLGEIGSRMAMGYRMRQGDGVLSMALLPAGFREGFLPWEDFLLIREGRFDQADKPLLSQAAANAIVWTDNQVVEVILDGQRAAEVAFDRQAQALVFVDETRGPAKLRLIKVASTQVARPGELVDFTLRFDNLGDQVIGNVTVIDNLTGRLEYVPDTAQSSLKANFLTQPTEGGSLALRWEIIDPLHPGQGGIVRFQCRVR